MRPLRIIASVLVLASASVPIVSTAATPAPAKPTPRNVFGQPDLSGAWSNATITPTTRNRRISDKASLTAAEAKVLESRWAQALAEDDKTTPQEATVKQLNQQFNGSQLAQFRPDFIAAGGDTGGYNSFWIDPGSHLIEIGGQFRTSILTTPDGQYPKSKTPRSPLQAAGRGDNYDNPEDRPLGERCVAGFGRNAGPPMLPNGYYNNSYEFLQTRDAVAIYVELIHEVRVIRLNGQHRTDGVRPSLGDSVGHYEGNTLVVETTNLPERENLMGSWKNLKITEWFTRPSPNTIVYRFQAEDPETWDAPWGGELTFHPLNGQVYEYACHEGNYALEGILAGARQRERDAVTKSAAANGDAKPR
jgi:hypothetical protein